MTTTEEIKNKLKELLKVINFELCELNSDSITINDSMHPNGFNEVIQLPTDYKTADDLRVFRSSKIDTNYFFKVLNTKYHKIPFNKNGVEFNISMSRTEEEKKDEEKFNLELFHNDKYYMIFIGRSYDEKYICCRINDKEWLDFSYTINPQNIKNTREISVSFDVMSQQAKKLTVVQDEEHSFIITKNFLNSNFLNEESQLITDNDVNKYFNAIAFRLKDIMSSVIEVISITNGKFLDIIYNDYPIVKEFIDMTNSKVNEELVDSFFEKCSNINVTKEREQTEKILTLK